MENGPIRFTWPVDQSGYEIEHKAFEQPQGLGMEREYDIIRGKGGPLRFYWPLEDDSLWLLFAHTCTTPKSALSFVNQFGLLTKSPERLDSFLGCAALLRRISERIESGELLSATKLFTESGLPSMKEGIFWYADKPEVFNFWLVPLTLRDALLHQAGEAITGNRQFRRCRNEKCPNWFRLRPQPRGQGESPNLHRAPRVLL